jgi:hypothetical protein
VRHESGLLIHAVTRHTRIIVSASDILERRPHTMLLPTRRHAQDTEMPALLTRQSSLDPQIPQTSNPDQGNKASIVVRFIPIFPASIGFRCNLVLLLLTLMAVDRNRRCPSPCCGSCHLCQCQNLP